MMDNDHEAVRQMFLDKLKEYTLKACCGGDYVLLSKFRHWLKEPRAGSYTMVSRLHDVAYRSWTKPARLISADQICEDNCILLFSILLEMGRGELIHEIWNRGKNDRHLPIDLYALLLMFEGMEDPKYQQLAEEFDQRQWKYCPAILEFNKARQYPQNQILPFSKREKINEKGGTAQLWVIEVLEEFVEAKLRMKVEGSKYECKDGLGPRYEFALKAFEDGNKFVFQNERDAFLALLNNKAMVQYLGCYSHKEEYYKGSENAKGLKDLPTYSHDSIPSEKTGVVRPTHNIILEFGESDLEEYFVDNQPPAFQPEVEAFWSGLVEVADAVKGIHTLETENGGKKKQFYGWHADIKPDNILIVHGKFKLADPGFVKFVEKTESNHKSIQDGGTETFGAPERHDGWEENPIEVDQSIDTWSLACVFSIAATWVVLGYQGVRQYNKLREKAILGIKKRMAALPEDQKSRPSLTNDAFHDGIQVLEAVKDWHKFLRNASRGTDTVTRRVLDLVDKRMLLQDPKARIQAHSLCKELSDIIRSSKTEARIPVPMSIQSLLQEVDEEAPQPSKLQSSQMNHQSITQPSALAPLTIANVRKSKFLGPALQKTANRSQVLRSILTTVGDNPALVTKSYSWRTDETGLSEGRRSAYGSHLESILSVSGSRDIQNHRGLPHDSHSAYQLSITAESPRPRTPQRSATIPHQTVSQAREESNSKMGKMKRDPLMSKYFVNRDIKFLVDNAESMAPFWSEAMFVLDVLLKKARGQDPDGMDLFFTNGRVKVEGKEAKGKRFATFKEDPFQAAMRNPDAQPILGLHTDITKSFGEIFTDYLTRARDTQRKVRNLTLIVLTDGRWVGLSHKEGFKTMIVKFVKTLNDLLGDFRQRPVSVQFVQFGRDPDATHRLWSLDNELKYDGIPDIIDTEHSEGNVNKMLLGSFNPEIDDADDGQSISSPLTQTHDEIRTLQLMSSSSTLSTYTTSPQLSRANTFAATPRTSTIDPGVGSSGSSIFKLRGSRSWKQDGKKT